MIGWSGWWDGWWGVRVNLSVFSNIAFDKRTHTHSVCSHISIRLRRKTMSAAGKWACETLEWSNPIQWLTTDNVNSFTRVNFDMIISLINVDIWTKVSSIVLCGPDFSSFPRVDWRDAPLLWHFERVGESSALCVSVFLFLFVTLRSCFRYFRSLVFDFFDSKIEEKTTFSVSFSM